MVPLSVASAVAVLLNFDHCVAASRALNLRRASSPNIDTADSSSSDGVVDISASRSLRADVDLAQCYERMAFVADERDILTKDAYFYFSDIMSNQWFSENDIFSYIALPYDMKFAFVTLACQCKHLGGGKDCCLNERAELNVDGAKGQDVSQAQTEYLNDICSLTYATIGSDRINPSPGDMPTTAQPTQPTTAQPTQPTTAQPTQPLIAPSPSPPPTEPPTTTPPPSEKVDIKLPNDPDYPSGGLGPGGIAGVSLAAAAVLTLILFLIGGRKEEEARDDENLDDIEADDRMKVDVNADLGDDAPDKDGSPDGTKSMTTVFSTQSTIATALNVSNTNILPVVEDSENEMDVGENTDQPHEIPGDLSSLSRYVMD